MNRRLLCLLASCTALAQVPQPASVQVALEAHWKALSEARFDDAAARREEARTLLEATPVDDPRFGSFVQSVAQLYEGAAMSQQARAVLESGLSRAAVLGESSAVRIGLLINLANSWQQDRNLLKTVPYLERAAAAVEAAPLETGPAPAVRPMSANRLGFSVVGHFNRFFTPESKGGVYLQLADIYRQVGRKEDAASILAKYQKLMKNDPMALGLFYENQNRLAEAAAIYKRQAEEGAADLQANPWGPVRAWQSLASVYQREQRFGDAAAALQQAIDSLKASNNPALANQGVGIRQEMAGVLTRAGQPQAADKIYEGLLAETSSGQEEMNRQVLISFANHLASTKRSAQAEETLKAYLSSHSNLSPQEDSAILFSLADVARMSGNNDKADEYQRLGMEHQAAQTASPEEISINSYVQRAQAMANARNFDEAFALALQAMDKASRAFDREQVVWMVPALASTFASNQQPDRGEQLYQRLFSLTEDWSIATLQPSLVAAQNYPRFLMQQPKRRDEAPDAIDRYRNLLIKAHGAGTGWQDEVLQMRIEFERGYGGAEKALAPAQEWLALEESLNGKVSEPYLRALQTMAEVTGNAGQADRALLLWRQAVTTADAVLPETDARPAYTRSSAAFAFAREGQFDEAERLMNEAIAFTRRLNPPQHETFIAQLEQIRQMKTHGAQQGNAQASSPFYAPAVRGTRWFDPAAK